MNKVMSASQVCRRTLVVPDVIADVNSGRRIWMIDLGTHLTGSMHRRKYEPVSIPPVSVHEELVALADITWRRLFQLFSLSAQVSSLLKHCAYRSVIDPSESPVMLAQTLRASMYHPWNPGL